LFAVIAGFGAVPLSEMEARAPVEAKARRQVSSPIGDMAGAGERPYHVTRDD